MNIYARREPTTDEITRKYVSPETMTIFADVVLYADSEAICRVARIPGHYTQSKPTRRNKWQMLNCFRYRLIWLPDQKNA